jgi:hypothetical protein
MKKNRTFLLLAAFALVASAFYGGHAYFKPNPDTSLLEPQFKNEASGLLKEFSTNDSAASRKYLGKVMVTRGIIRDIEKHGPDFFTIVLGNRGEMSSVRCEIDKHHVPELASLHSGSLAEVKGIFTGFNKDDTGLLGSDAQLTRCVVVNNK